MAQPDSQRFRLGFGWQKFVFFGCLGGACAEVIEVLDGAIEVTAHACVVAIDEIEVRTQALDGGGVADGVVGLPVLAFDFLSLFFNLHIDHGGFDRSGAADAPARGGDFFY